MAVDGAYDQGSMLEPTTYRIPLRMGGDLGASSTLSLPTGRQERTETQGMAFVFVGGVGWALMRLFVQWSAGLFFPATEEENKGGSERLTVRS